MGLKVLIVEDEGIVALHLCTMLAPMGWNCIGIVDTGDKAIEIAKWNRADLVLMDIRINANLNGVETAVCLQGIYEEPIQVLFVTGFPLKSFP